MFDTRYMDNEENYLWNGHLYSFIVGKERYKGVYKKFRCAFFDKKTGNKICGVGQALDIQNTTPSTIK